jgi:hypothetical protein
MRRSRLGFDPDRLAAHRRTRWVLLLTFVAAAAAWYVVASVNISRLLAANFTAGEVIRERSPFHLIRPEWVAGKDQADILGR